MNNIQLIGRLTKDPELKFGQSGKAYARFTLAVDRPFTKDSTDFINCVAFGKPAEIIGEYVRKGHKFGVCGFLQMDTYEHNGEKRTAYTVVVNSFDFLEGRKEAANNERIKTQEDDINIVNDEFPF